MILLSVKDRLLSELSKSFDSKIKFEKRIRVMSDLMLFKPMEDKSVWLQKKGMMPEYFTVYFDGEYICGFDANQSAERAVLEFWKGFKQAYMDGKIRLSQTMELPKKEKKKAKATTKEEKMAVEISERLDNAK